jgi:hypothetical protein
MVSVERVINIMEKIIIAYSRHDNLGNNYNNEFKYKAREIIDNVADEIGDMNDTCITSIFAEIKETLWKADGIIVPVYSLNINQKYLAQYKIEELMGHEIKEIANRLNEIILEKISKL